MTPEELVYHEADLLDGRRFDDWLELFTEDCVYWLPQRDGDDPGRAVSLVYDNRQAMRGRVVRLKSGFAFSQDPPSRTCHLIGNVRTSAKEDGYEVRSSLLVTEVRRGGQHSYSGAMEHLLVSTDAGLRIKQKVVRLVNADLPLGNLSFLI
ncbi:aromatic-ring-hydroxylating dioxygenase subunit beta [Amycolatopsis pigmentata]|uniref:Aromatic-ring-hydroxylating dioxygenase subunit beta n=1 Tax=Amycolatopsis pigmentata TaxID=450801 RepID=A0ABW5FPG1_9PSEU